MALRCYYALQKKGICTPSSTATEFHHLNQCDDCHQTVSHGMMATDGVIVRFHCDSGHDLKEWWVCCLCHRVHHSHTKFLYKRSLVRHLESKLHSKAVMTLTKTRADWEKEARARAIRLSRQLIEKFFPNGGLVADYFGYQLVTGFSGVHSLVIRANFLKCFDHARDKIDVNEGLLDYNSAQFYRHLTKSQSQTACELFRAFYELGKIHAKQDASGEIQHHRRIEPPRTFNEVVNRYSKSARSIYQSLPIPTVNTVDSHAYSNILECYAISAANGNDIASIPMSMTQADVGVSITDVSRSPRALELAEWARGQGFPEGTKIIPYIIWRDDVEPNWTKNNRGSVWLCTVSFLGVGKYWNSRGCTFPLAIGKSRDSHRAIEELIHHNMRLEMEKPQLLFSALSPKHQELVVGRPLLILTDSPEKRKATMTAVGHQKFHSRFRCSANHKKLLPIIQPCNTCLAAMRVGKHPNPCQICANWDALTKDEVIRDLLKLTPHENYPMSHLDNQEGIQYLTDDDKILPFEITYDRLKLSMKLAFHNFANEIWSENQVKEFLSVECFCSELVKQVIDHGTNARIINKINNSSSDIDEDDQLLFLLEAEQEPEYFSIPKSPTVWDAGDDLSIFVDAPMHLLFLGIFKSTLMSIKKWLEKRGYLNDFHQRCQSLNQLLDDVRLEWMKIEDFREGKFGGWVAENFVGFSKVFLWFFQDVSSFMREEFLGDDSIPPSVSPNTRWQKKHCLRWLHDRGLEKKGTVAEIKVFITSKIRDNGGEAPPMLDRSGEHIPDQLERVLLSLHSLLVTLMANEVVPGVTSKEAELKIKHFLSEFHLLNMSYLGENKKPKVIGASNYLTLLNLPAIMERYGPLRQLWEGHFHGEGYVRCAKPNLRYGQRMNFAQNGMTHCLREAAYHMANESLSLATKPRTSNEWANRLLASSASYRRYKDRVDLVNHISGHRVVSTVIFLTPAADATPEATPRDVCIYGVVHTSISSDDMPVQLQLYRLTNSSELISAKLTLQYSEWKVAITPTDFGDLVTLHPLPRSSVTFGCLLPLTSNKGNAAHTMICQDNTVKT